MSKVKVVVGFYGRCKIQVQIPPSEAKGKA
jgi:hypothetical protein